MIQTAAFSATVRLVAFANLDITVENWRTLWMPPRGRTAPRDTSGGVDTSGLREAFRAALAGVGRGHGTEAIPGEKRRAPKQGSRDARRALEYEYDLPDHPVDLLSGDPFIVPRPIARTSRALATARQFEGRLADAIRFGGGDAEWPAKTRHSVRVDYKVLSVAHRRTRAFLGAICDGADLTPFLRQRGGVGLRVELVDAARALRETLPGYLPRRQRSWIIRRDHHFDLVLIDPGNLEDHLMTLFALSATGGMWTRIVRCEATRCAKFRVVQVSKRDSRYCSDACRKWQNRQDAIPTRRLGPFEGHANFIARVKSLRAQGVRQPVEKAAKEFGISTADAYQYLGRF